MMGGPGGPGGPYRGPPPNMPMNPNQRPPPSSTGNLFGGGADPLGGKK